MSNPNYLEDAWVYLSGGMNYVEDEGVAWRREFIYLSHKYNLNLLCLDPTDKPLNHYGDNSVKEEKEYQKRLKETKQWKTLKNYVSLYRREDLRYVDLSDFVVVHIDPTVPQWGTADETYFAESQHKPRFFICEGGLKNLPTWLFDVIDVDDPSEGTRCNVFESAKEVIQELVKYNSGELKMGDKWLLLRKNINKYKEKQFELIKSRLTNFST